MYDSGKRAGEIRLIMTKQQDALRIAAKFLRMQSLGYRVTPDECKLISALCWLSLPMKYRLNKQEIAALEAQVAMQAPERADAPATQTADTEICERCGRETDYAADGNCGGYLCRECAATQEEGKL